MSLRDIEQLSEVESHLQSLVHNLGRAVQLFLRLFPMVRVLPLDPGGSHGGMSASLLLAGIVDDALAHLRVDLVNLRHLIVQVEEKEEGLGHICFALEICL